MYRVTMSKAGSQRISAVQDADSNCNWSYLANTPGVVLISRLCTDSHSLRKRNKRNKGQASSLVRADCCTPNSLPALFGRRHPEPCWRQSGGGGWGQKGWPGLRGCLRSWLLRPSPAGAAGGPDPLWLLTPTGLCADS